MISAQDGKLLVSLARAALQAHFSKLPLDTSDYRERFQTKQGVFVTLKKLGELRGCIGYPLPIYPLLQGVCKAALAAALSDPRFEPLTESELAQIDIEISVLTVPEQLESGPQAAARIQLGKHGVIAESGHSSGLLLPQVATEHQLDAESFLENVCLKAGLNSSCWKQTETRLYTFEAQIFTE
jgi:uncharacterized protein